MNQVAGYTRASAFMTPGAHLLVAMLGVRRCIGVADAGDRFRDMTVPADQDGASIMQVFLLPLVARDKINLWLKLIDRLPCQGYFSTIPDLQVS